MFSSFSVKKPYYVLVGVIIALVLGGVSLSYMKTNLLPDFEVPYLMVITTDVGAAPEQVEEDVSDPLEGALSGLTGVQNVTCYSAENYSAILLEYVDGTDMDSALVKASAAVNQVASELPDTAGTPTYMQMSMDMVASMYLGVTSDNMDMSELSDFVDENIVPSLERLDGVASVSTAGGVENTVNIELDQDKIDLVNDGILGKTNKELARQKRTLKQTAQQLKDSQQKLEEGQKALDEQKAKTADELAEKTEQITTLMITKGICETELQLLQSVQKIVTDATGKASTKSSIAVLESALEGVEQSINALQGKASTASDKKALKRASKLLKQLKEKLQSTVDSGEISELQNAIDSLETAIEQMSQATNAYSMLDSGKTQGILALAEAQNKIDDGLAQIKTAQAQVKQGRAQLKEARKTAREQANVNAMLTPATLAQMITAQNMEMPAGYVEDKSGNEWMVKVGESFDSVKQIRNLVLTKIDGVGKVRIRDVANVVVVNNVGDSFASLNGSKGLVLSIGKTSTANVGDVSKAVNAQVEKIEAANEGLDVIKIMDQGDYVSLYIWTILKSLLLGALLAVIVLAFFLRDVKPTLIVAFSIPFSVLFSLVIMYFTGLDLNIMTLGAMSLAIGMLVDNSIVVMENIYRLRQRGYAPARAAAQGARQVGGAVIASTATTVCVFLPMVFTEGTVRSLMVPFALTISYALIASLVVALTVVPALGSVIFKNMKPRSGGDLGRVQTVYGRVLGWCLAHKAPTLLVALALLVGSLAGVVNMGIVLIPSMTSNNIMFTLEMPEDMEQDDAYKLAGKAVDIAVSTEGVGDVGCVDSNFTSSMVMSSMSEANSYSGRFIMYCMLDDSVTTESGAKDLKNRLSESLSGLGCTVTTSDSMSSMSSMTSGDASIEVKGEDYEEVLKLTDEVVDVVDGIEGYEDVSNGQEDADPTLHLLIDKNKAARYGTTVGQIYASLAADLQDSTSAFTLTTKDGDKMDVKIDQKDLVDVKRGNILDYTFENTSGDEYKLSKVATVTTEEGLQMITHVNGAYMGTVSASIADGYNTTLLARQLQPELDKIDVPDGYTIEISGTDETISDMIRQMALLAVLGFFLLYLVMVAQFQSLLSPFIIVFTVPLAFTGGLIALMIAGEQLSLMSLLGFVILMGTVVNNGIVFVDYANQMRLSGMAKRYALIATGQTRMRPIMMTALTTILSMCALIFTQDIGSSMERGMALVVAGGLLYATFMTLLVVPIVYDIFCRKPLRPIDLGSDIDEGNTDAEEHIARMGEDARETYEYETARERRRRIRMEGGAHGKRHLAKKERERKSLPEDVSATEDPAEAELKDAPTTKQADATAGDSADTTGTSD